MRRLENNSPDQPFHNFGASNDLNELNKNSRSPECEAPKLLKGRPGFTYDTISPRNLIIVPDDAAV